MKRVIGLLCVIAVALLVPMVAMAGDYHRGATLVCSDCHTMHFSQQHSYLGADSVNAGYGSSFAGGFTPLGGAGPHKYLLRNEVNELCLTCHNNQTFAPDVLGANSNGYVRMAGALNELSDGPIIAATGHTLNTTDPAPGSSPAWAPVAPGLECANCHFPHGGANYRNLAGNPGNYSALGRTYAAVTYQPGGANLLTVDVWEHSAALGNLSTHYNQSNTDFNEPAGDAKYAGGAYAFWCKGCHTNFHGVQGDNGTIGGAGNEGWLRHPNAVVNIGALGGGHSSYTRYTVAGKTNYVKTMSASGTWPANDNTPSCFSCHKSHGNENAFGLIYMEGTGAVVSEEGDQGPSGTVKQLCRQCHIQGG